MPNTFSLSFTMDDDGLKKAHAFLSQMVNAEKLHNEMVAEVMATPGATVVHDELQIQTEPSSASDARAEVERQMTEAPEFVAGGTDTDPELDSAGLPWDERIHSRGKTKNADGTWRKKKGVDPDLVTDVEAELKPTPTPSVQTESQAEATPPPGAAEAMNNIEPLPRYKHGDHVFTRAQLVDAGWNADQIDRLEKVEDAPPPAETATPMTFAQIAARIGAEKLDMAMVNSKVAEVAADKGKPQVQNFALLAVPTHADILAGLAAALWPEG